LGVPEFGTWWAQRTDFDTDVLVPREPRHMDMAILEIKMAELEQGLDRLRLLEQSGLSFFEMLKRVDAIKYLK
jgi:hypothetical protein